ncbi:MAG: aminotransferase class I/II-fold pyridoxal phosphate-dependent enzyme [Bifidobacteriaceae bacterium]|jgi:O-acetylhomoserine (thiol)-lyase|nr:aminotransferase class I/II-fold pyridoxal phosphate-dependent enzyme [Bifidobacteriaceae bacterium]
MSASWGFTTRQLHAAATPEPVTGALAPPIFQTTAYAFPDPDSAAARFDGREAGFTYSRLNNPTVLALEERVAALEGGASAVAVASGQAAVAYALATLAGQGDHIVASSALYGGTRTLLSEGFARRGTEVGFVAGDAAPDAWAAAIGPKTKALFVESIANPGGQIADLAALAHVAHGAGLPLVVDNTVATPYVTRPIEWGADVVVHSASKYLSGHGTVIAGVIVDAGAFDFGLATQRFADFNRPVVGFDDLVLARDFGAGGGRGRAGVNESYIVKVRLEQLHDFGACLAPFNAFLTIQGLETLSLRMDRHLSNAQAVAEFLVQRRSGGIGADVGTGAEPSAATGPATGAATGAASGAASGAVPGEEADPAAVTTVTYSGLPTSPFHELARRYAPKGPGGIVAFDLAGGEPAARAFVGGLRLHSHVANIGDVRSLAIHPGSTTHGQISPQSQREAGVRPGTVRLSVGIEDVEDILEDLELGFAAARRLA